MASPQNIAQVNVNTNPVNSKNYFNNFFINFNTISTAQSDVVQAFFEEFTDGDQSAADLLTSAVIFTSISQGTNPMDVLTQFAKLPNGQLNSYLAMFLNLNRVGTSYLGINNQPVINKYVQRSILL